MKRRRDQMTEAWKRSVDARLIEIGKTREWLAKQVGTSKSTITQMLGDEQEASVHVDAVCVALGIAHPVIGASTELIAEAMAIMKSMSPEDQLNFVRVLRGMRKGE